ncbi:hypothetical protein CDAR_394831 [Caerostris darwini]|uniref:Uncharacterized protein n=1 Tax=Caerostris darwini TaxID=1538125 RepID=A0AAV4RSB8_9ARAC|nr:hypothetical protein CDAR_394831 [Caerostris darwini]
MSNSLKNSTRRGSTHIPGFDYSLKRNRCYFPYIVSSTTGGVDTMDETPLPPHPISNFLGVWGAPVPRYGWLMSSYDVSLNPSASVLSAVCGFQASP